MTKSRVFITGDTHCPIDIGKLRKKRFTVGRNLTKNDIVIICGDAGFVWDTSEDSQWIEWISRQPWTTVFCDGNHDNHDLLATYPIVEFHGAKAHKISDSLFHILRGEIMIIDGVSFFFFGGGFSHDIFLREEHISWWQNELPTSGEIENALNNLKKQNNRVDYIITHDAPAFFVKKRYGNLPKMTPYDNRYFNICSFLEYIYQNIKFCHWFLGHYHLDETYQNMTVLYNRIIETGNVKNSTAKEKI